MVPRPAAVVLVGGEDSTGYTSRVEAWNLEDGSWVQCKDVPRPRQGFALASLDERVYLFGGTDDEDVELSSTEVFDALAGVWLRGLPSMHEARTGAAACVSGRCAFVLGGNGGDASGYLASVERLRVDEGVWEVWPPMLQARADAAAAVTVGGQLYAVGGRDGGDTLASAERCDCSNFTCGVWEALPDMATPRSMCAAAAVGDAILAVGGFNDAVYLSSVERYDPAAQHWDSVTPMSVPRSAAGVVEIAGSLYVFGGSSAGALLDMVERYDPLPCGEGAGAAPSAMFRVAGTFFARASPTEAAACQPPQAALAASGSVSASASYAHTHSHSHSHTQTQTQTSTHSSSTYADPHLTSLAARGATFFEVVEADQRCFICYNCAPDAVLLECGHAGICVTCAAQLPRLELGQSSCPICRCSISCIMRLRPEDSSVMRAGESGVCETPAPVPVAVDAIGAWATLPPMAGPRAAFGITVLMLDTDELEPG